MNPFEYANAFKNSAGLKCLLDGDTTGILNIPYASEHCKIWDTPLYDLLFREEYFTKLYSVKSEYLDEFVKLLSYELMCEDVRNKHGTVIYVSPTRWKSALMFLLNNNLPINYANFLNELVWEVSDYFDFRIDDTSFLNKLDVNSRITFIFKDPEKYIKVANGQLYFNTIFNAINSEEHRTALVFLPEEQLGKRKILKKEKLVTSLTKTLRPYESYLSDLTHLIFKNKETIIDEFSDLINKNINENFKKIEAHYKTLGENELVEEQINVLDASNKMLALAFMKQDLDTGAIDPVAAMDMLSKISSRSLTGTVLDVFEKIEQTLEFMSDNPM